jgi:hypothetical protein
VSEASPLIAAAFTEGLLGRIGLQEAHDCGDDAPVWLFFELVDLRYQQVSVGCE